MYITEDITFKSTNDFELGYDGVTRETDYHIVTPENGSKGLVVYIPGYGGDTDGSYRRKFCQSIAEKNQLSVMSVNYHCIFCRPDNGATRSYETEDLKHIKMLAYKYGVEMDNKPLDTVLAEIDAKLVERGANEEIHVTLVPKKNEYQNGGIMAALDIINAVNDASSRWDIPTNNIVLIGSSYGGYIANLASKLAPNTFRAIFDNSSWAKPNLTYILGRDLNVSEYSQRYINNLIMRHSVRTCWTAKEGLPTTFDDNRIAVRSFTTEQINQFADYKPTAQYYFIHALNDHIANTNEKIAMVKDMVGNGIDVHMIVADEEDVDGSYIKNTNHGLGLSLQQFFKHGYDHIEQTRPADNLSTDTNFSLKSEIRYTSDQFEYIFDYSQTPIQGRVEQTKR